MADGQAYLDGEEWVAITPYEHPGDQKVYTLAVTAEGAVWLGTDVGALRRDPDTGAWSRFAADERITSVLPAADGTVWLLSNWETPWRLTPGGPRLYEEREFLARHEIAHTFLGAHPAESGVWIATGLGVARFDAATETWVHYTAETTHNALEPDLNWEYTPASDGGLWLTQGDELFYARPEEGLWLLVEVPVLVEGESIGNILATADGAVWLNNRQGVFRCRR
jgi:ligand-binding sensor domain-containing protein